MSEAEASPAAAYRRWPSGERRRHERPLREAMLELRRVLPLGRGRFERLLATALADAVRHGTGFYLGGFAARRALGSALLVDIDPSRLEHQLDHRVQQGKRAFSVRDRFLGAGDWTGLLHPLESSFTHREVMEIVKAEGQYRNTPSYRRALVRAGTPRPVKRNFVALSTPAKVESYFRLTADMCGSIQKYGLLRSSEYGQRLASFARPTVRLPWSQLGEGDVGVAIGAAGELYRFASGKHRTAAAQALELKSMPVEIRLVHADWLARQMAESGLAPLDALLEAIRNLRFAAI